MFSVERPVVSNQPPLTKINACGARPTVAAAKYRGSASGANVDQVLVDAGCAGRGVLRHTR
jgi:hypothetical protein